MGQNGFSPTLSEKSNFISVKDAANYIGVSVFTIYRLVHDKAFPAKIITVQKSRPLIRIQKDTFLEWSRKADTCTN